MWWRRQPAHGLGAGEVQLVDGPLLRPGLRLPDWDGTRRHLADVDGTVFDAFVRVERGRLERVTLIVADPAISGTGWHDHDPERIRRFHDTFLAERLGEGRPWKNGSYSYPYGGITYRYRWGRVESSVEPRNLEGHIELVYY